MDTYMNKESKYCIDSMLSTCFRVCFFPIILHFFILAIAASPVALCHTFFHTFLIISVVTYDRAHFVSPNLLHSDLHSFFLCRGLLLFAAATCHSPPHQPRSWKIDLITERQRGRKTQRERENRRVGSVQGTELQYLWLCFAAVKCCCFNWSQTQLNAAVSSSQPDPKTIDTHPPTHTHTHTPGGQIHRMMRLRQFKKTEKCNAKERMTGN